MRRCTFLFFIMLCTGRLLTVARFGMQIVDEVKKSFVIEMVKGSLRATVTDIRSSKTLAFDAGAHMIHICTASLDNVDGEAAGFLSGRGGERYPPIIVCGRFFQRTSLLVI